MDPIVAAAIVAAIGGFGTAVLARHASQDAAEAKTEADKTTLELSGVKIQLDAWPALYQSVITELAREREARAEERAIAEAFAAKADRLEAERDQARSEISKWRTLVASMQEERHDSPPN